ncbi:hypothetical protein [Paenibacillus xylanivorans]|uniref:Uncharacterized protein n=1 Tax=Paenibacillus xylanivorans TaxID=1705561 RepID=A0A0M9BHT5_9BACL|nr:hypothetical protein [Paenibacillus xylanivorans]KOY12600.1 hypothetical protein AMS66_29765 [Paenibacillus xylanivorans]
MQAAKQLVEYTAGPALQLIVTPDVDRYDYSGNACELFPNWTRTNYRTYAKQPFAQRLQIAETMAELYDEYYYDNHLGGDGRFRTQLEYQRLERLADYILAEDHAKGLSIMRDPYDMPRDRDLIVPPGSGAREFMRKHSIRIYCEADAKGAVEKFGGKLCQACQHPFEGRGNQLNCGPTCRRLYKTLWERKKRYGTIEFEGERNRMQLEYGFYSPQEMENLQERSEQSYGASKKLANMADAKRRKESHGRKNTVQLIDKKGTEGAGYLDGVYGWTSDRNQYKGTHHDIWWGEMVTYNMYEQPLTEKFVDCRKPRTVHISA